MFSNVPVDLDNGREKLDFIVIETLPLYVITGAQTIMRVWVQCCTSK